LAHGEEKTTLGIFLAERMHRPDSLESVIIYMDFDESRIVFSPRQAYLDVGQRDSLWSDTSRFIPRFREMKNLRHLSLAHLVDAAGFFNGLPAMTNVWHKLETVALTSTALHYAELHRRWGVNRIIDLLKQAAVHVLDMPALKSMSFWNGGLGHAAAFIYNRDDERCRITWRGNWHVDLGPVRNN
jgi:hypothetical protein